MEKIGLTKLRKCNTIADLENLSIGYLTYDISYRGGYLGFSSSNISASLGIDQYLLPNKVGVYVNYLGGGVRGSLCKSDYNDNVSGRKKELLDELLDACYRAYVNAENQTGLNDETDEQGETNWDALATKVARNNGFKSAY